MSTQYDFSKPLTVVINEALPRAKNVVKTSGRGGKYYSKVYHYTLDDLNTNEELSELDMFFGGKVDAVKRLQAYGK